MTNYYELPEFKKDFKSLLKKFKTLEEDFETMKRFLIEGQFLNNMPIAQGVLCKMEGFCNDKSISYKIRKFACRSLSGKGANSKIRVIFVYEDIQKKITFVEIYFKGNKENEDRDRLKNFIDGLEI